VETTFSTSDPTYVEQIKIPVNPTKIFSWDEEADWLMVICHDETIFVITCPPVTTHSTVYEMVYI